MEYHDERRTLRRCLLIASGRSEWPVGRSSGGRETLGLCFSAVRPPPAQKKVPPKPSFTRRAPIAGDDATGLDRPPSFSSLPPASPTVHGVCICIYGHHTLRDLSPNKCRESSLPVITIIIITTTRGTDRIRSDQDSSVLEALPLPTVAQRQTSGVYRSPLST